MKSWLEKNDIEMHSTHNKEKSVVAERFIKTLKNKIYKYVNSISKNVYIDQLDDIVNKYNNANHKTIKMKPANLKSTTYFNSSKEINDKDPKFKIGDIVEISKYRNIFVKGIISNWFEEVFVIKKIIFFPGHMLLVIIKTKRFLERFVKKNCKKQIKNSSMLKMINYLLNGKAMIILLTVGLIKKTSYKWVNIFQNRIP